MKADAEKPRASMPRRGQLRSATGDAVSCWCMAARDDPFPDDATVLPPTSAAPKVLPDVPVGRETQQIHADPRFSFVWTSNQQKQPVLEMVEKHAEILGLRVGQQLENMVYLCFVCFGL